MAEFRRRRAKLRVKAEEIDYKNVELLKRFVSDKGKINPSRLTGANAKLQRKIAKAVKRARNIALIPYTRIEKYFMPHSACRCRILGIPAITTSYASTGECAKRSIINHRTWHNRQ